MLVLFTGNGSFLCRCDVVASNQNHSPKNPHFWSIWKWVLEGSVVKTSLEVGHGAACVIYCRVLRFLTETHPMPALSQMPFMSDLTLTLSRVAACWTFLQGLRGGVFERWRRRGRRRWRRRACAEKKKKKKSKVLEWLLIAGGGAVIDGCRRAEEGRARWWNPGLRKASLGPPPQSPCQEPQEEEMWRGVGQE